MCRTSFVSPEQPVLCIPERPTVTTVLAKNGIMGECPCSQNSSHLCCLGCCIAAARFLPEGYCRMYINKRFVAWLLDCAAISCMVQCWSAGSSLTFVLLSVECPSSSEVEMLNLLQFSSSFAAISSDAALIFNFVVHRQQRCSALSLR